MDTKMASDMLAKIGFRIEDIPVLTIEPSPDEVMAPPVERDAIMDAQNAAINSKLEIKLEDGEEDHT